MRIGIDARFLTHPQPGGFKTYTQNLISALAKSDCDNEYVLYLDRQPGENDLIPVQANFSTRVIPGSVPLIGLPWREQVGLPRQVRKDRIELFHAPCLTAPLKLPCPLVVTVHDMIWAFPENFTSRGSWSIKRRFMDWYNYLVPKYALRHAAAVLTVSQASKKSIVENSNADANRVIVTYPAAGAAFRQADDPNLLAAARNHYGLSSDYILGLGAADPRKNIKSLIQAYASLPKSLQEQYLLAIVWTHPFLASEISKQVEELGIQQNVRFLRQVSNADLALIYNAASLFVFPSLYEGFGLPVLEAMACGAPVAAADNSSIPEIAGGAALLFNGLSVQEISRTMAHVLEHRQVRQELVQKGLKRHADFSWEGCARDTLAVYQEVLASQHV